MTWLDLHWAWWAGIVAVWLVVLWLIVRAMAWVREPDENGSRYEERIG